MGEEISAACLDWRKRKIILGNIKGQIAVYNPSNGALMKSAVDDNDSPVIGLEYFDSKKQFFAGYGNGLIKIFDETSSEDCRVIRTFEKFNQHPELRMFKLSPEFETVITAGISCGQARLWK
jgi:WD40 repeat protein